MAEVKTIKDSTSEYTVSVEVTKINIKHSKSGGVISIKYSTMNELQGIIEKIRNTNKK